MSETIYSITSVKADVGKSLPPTLILYVEGVASTSGWTNPSLSKHIYTHPPEDGMQGYTFVADKPSGHVLQVLTPIEVDHAEPLEDWVKGVHVDAATNTVKTTVP